MRGVSRWALLGSNQRPPTCRYLAAVRIGPLRCAHTVVERNVTFDRTAQRTRTNADPCHPCHAVFVMGCILNAIQDAVIVVGLGHGSVRRCSSKNPITFRSYSAGAVVIPAMCCPFGTSQICFGSRAAL